MEKRNIIGIDILLREGVTVTYRVDSGINFNGHDLQPYEVALVNALVECVKPTIWPLGSSEEENT